jgi:dephospho-CoA kinase
VAHYLQERGYAYHSLSDVVREEALRLGLTTSRDDLVRTGNDLRRPGGPGALVARLAPRLRPPAVVDSIRNPGEVEALRALPGFFLLAVDAPAEIRFRRTRQRDRTGDAATLEEFRHFEARENSGHGDEQRIAATLSLAQAEVINDETLEVLRRRVDVALGGPA